ncbi:hypothetical protein FJZ26_04385 [Candidatus Parvarchaeota archaeon]|nr:hypothetical protein [Candidatus Parvarchaeota archaeon]
MEKQGRHGSQASAGEKMPGFKEQFASACLKAYKSKALYYLLAATFLLFLFTRHPIFGLGVAISVICLLAVETAVGVKEGGWKNEIKEIAVAIVAAVVFWYGLGFVLATPSPLNAIVSCSMLPQLERGDMVILQGGQINAPKISATQTQAEALFGKAEVYGNGEFLESVDGSVYSFCTNPNNANSQACTLFRTTPELVEERRGDFTFKYSRCERKQGQRIYQVPCASSVVFGQKEYRTELENDIVVYTPRKNEIYWLSTGGGDIIHRALLKVDSPQGQYLLTKGDNNEIFDAQYYNFAYGLGNQPAKVEGQYKGKVVVRIPYLGYLKLFISGLLNPSFFPDPQGCDMVYV